MIYAVFSIGGFLYFQFAPPHIKVFIKISLAASANIQRPIRLCVFKIEFKAQEQSKPFHSIQRLEES